MNLTEQVYAAAASVGFLKHCKWLTLDGRGVWKSGMVELKAADDTVLSNLTLSTETTISCPSTLFPGIKKTDLLEIEGVRYQVREVRAVADGSEIKAKLAKI